uniref:RING-type E3 ubiquitin transferase n=1 Tax=Branchiostoma floridae TaxID=7739 RepID=C3YSC3_BRAFL|eukprot:XP_002601016.1 hypothetical protein BRAFLDRAFT_128153 [Branchiostoma floridae]
MGVAWVSGNTVESVTMATETEAKVTFLDAAAVETVLGKPHVLNGVEVRVQRWSPPENAKVNTGKTVATTGTRQSDLPARISNDFLECSICCDIFKKPKILIPCLHTFCALCLQEWVKRNVKETFPCPLCCHEVTLPQNGVAGLKDNFFMESLVEALAEQNNIRHGKDGINCTNCDEGKAATSRCSECAEFLCARCESAHRVVKATKGHTLFPFEELKIGKYDNIFRDRKAPLCSKHPGEILKLYCRTCETPICNECALFEHRDAQHDYTHIEEVATEKRKAILDLTLQCQAQIKFFHREEDAQKRLKQHLLKHAEEARKNVRSTVQSLITLVKEEGDRLLACIDTEVGCRKKQIEAGIEGAQTSLASTKSTCEFAETLAREGGDYEVASFSQEMMQRLSVLARPRFHTVDFELANVTIDYSVMKKKLPEHPNPGKRYSGMLYRAYLPYTSDGLRVLHLLEKAFNQKLMFTIRASRGGSD